MLVPYVFSKMATEVTVRVRDNNLGQAFFVQQEEWEFCLSDIRGILRDQEVGVPKKFRFLTANGNVVSPPHENTVTFRDVVEKEPFAEIKNVPQIVIIAEEDHDSTSNQTQTPERQTSNCPFIVKFPCFASFQGIVPCTRNIFNVNTLLKMAFLLTCLLFLMTFVLSLAVHVLFGVGSAAGYASFTGPGLGGMWMFPHHHHQHGAAAGEDLTQQVAALKEKLSVMEVSHTFELEDLKRKLRELEDLYLRDLEIHSKEIQRLAENQATLEKRIAAESDGFTRRLDNVEREGLARFTTVKGHGDLEQHLKDEFVVGGVETEELRKVGDSVDGGQEKEETVFEGDDEGPMIENIAVGVDEGSEEEVINNEEKEVVNNGEEELVDNDGEETVINDEGEEKERSVMSEADEGLEKEIDTEELTDEKIIQDHDEKETKVKNDKQKEKGGKKKKDKNKHKEEKKKKDKKGKNKGKEEKNKDKKGKSKD